MSFSNPRTTLKSPCKIWVTWDGANGGFVRYNKETKANEPVKLGKMVVLDKLSKLTGFDEVTNRGYNSNEVHDLRTEVITLKDSTKVIMKGLYPDMKEDLPKGAKFAVSIYFMSKIDGEYAIGNLVLKGAALSSFIKTEKEFNQHTHGLMVSGTEEGKKGAVKFVTPVFSTYELSQEEIENAIKLDATLQEYFKRRKGGNVSDDEEEDEGQNTEGQNTEPTAEVKKIEVTDYEDDDLPF